MENVFWHKSSLVITPNDIFLQPTNYAPVQGFFAIFLSRQKCLRKKEWYHKGGLAKYEENVSSGGVKIPKKSVISYLNSPLLLWKLSTLNTKK